MKEILEHTNSHEPLKALKQESRMIANTLKALTKQRLHSTMTDKEYNSEYSRLNGLYEEIKLKIEDLKQKITKEHLMRRRYYALNAFIETNYQDLSIIKSFFGLILIIGKNHVRHVIDDTFSIIDDLHQDIDKINQLPTILKGTYFDLQTKENLYYEVIIYERN